MDDHSPASAGTGGLRAINAKYTRGLCAALESGEPHPVRYIGNPITIGINLELVHCFGCERLYRRRSRRVFARRRMHVYDQDGFPFFSGFGKGVQIREVESGVPLREAEVRAR